MTPPPPTLALFLPSLAGGGAERVFVQLANEFRAAGLIVHMVLTRAHGPYLKELEPGIPIIDLGKRGVLRSLPGLVRYLRDSRPAAILSGLEHANIVAVLAKRVARVSTRCVVSLRSLPSLAYRHAPGWRARAILVVARMVLPHADRLIANSSGAADDAAQFFRLPRQRFSVIYNPLSLEEIRKSSLQPAGHDWIDKPDCPVVVSVGRLDVLKDFPTLIEAVARVRVKRPCRLIMLGEGPQREALAALAGGLGLGSDDIDMPGFVENPFAYMRGAAVFVSTSLTEGCPNALMQALCCGVPVVSTDCPGGVREILEDGAWGALVPVGDVDAVARAILEALDDAGTGEPSARAADFLPAAIAREYQSVLLDEPARPS